MQDEIKRLNRKLQRRDKRIKGLERKVSQLQEALAHRSINSQKITLDIRRSVQEAMCNVRHIPVFGLGCEQVIAEVRVVK